MSVLDKLDRVEELLKHQPGRHDQQTHAGDRGGAGDHMSQLAGKVESKTAAVKAAGAALADELDGEHKHSGGRSTVTASGDAGKKLYERGRAVLKKHGFEKDSSGNYRSDELTTYAMVRRHDNVRAHFSYNSDADQAKVVIQ